MSESSQGKNEKTPLCARCHWKNENPGLCNYYNPPVVLMGTPETPSDCGFFPESRWLMRSEDQRDEMLKKREERSAWYWSKRKSEPD